MKKTLIVLGCMSLGLAHAQQNGRDHAQHQTPDTRVGINTENPVATLELKKVEGLPATQVQGFMLPHINQTERNAFTKEALVNGVMIFNTTKNCIDWWDGTNWQCLDGSQKDSHGDEYGKYRATFSYTDTAEFTKNDCPTGQRGSKVSYSNTITGKGVSNTSQEEANRLAETNAKAEFERLGQEFANTTGICQIVTAVMEKCPDFEHDDYYKNNGYTLYAISGNKVGDFYTNLLISDLTNKQTYPQNTLKLSWVKRTQKLYNVGDKIIGYLDSSITTGYEFYQTHWIELEQAITLNSGNMHKTQLEGRIWDWGDAYFGSNNVYIRGDHFFWNDGGNGTGLSRQVYDAVDCDLR